MGLIAWVLAASVALNVALGMAYLGERDKATEQTTRLEGAGAEIQKTEAAAQQCSDGVDRLAKAGEVRAEAASENRKVAKVKADVHYQRADKVLAAPAPVPHDACMSAQVRMDEWLKERNP
jgi:hypothetical protein